MIDDKTTHYKLPLPHADNLLSEDVGRLRDGLTQIDQALRTSATALEEESEARAEALQAEKEAREALAGQLARQRAGDLEAQAAHLKKIRILALAGL